MAAAGTLTVPLLFAVALVAFLLAGIAQSLTGFGSSLVAAPLLALVAGAGTTVVAVTLVSLVLTGWAGLRERQHVVARPAIGFSVAGVVGLPFGLVLLTRASDAALETLMAVTVLVALALTASPLRLPAGDGTIWGTGVCSGTLLAATGMNGPPLVLGMAAQGLSPRRFRGTLQVVLCGQDVAAVVGFLLVGSLHPAALAVAAVGVVVSPLGWRIGDRLFDRIPPALFRRVLVAGLALSAAMLVLPRLI